MSMISSYKNLKLLWWLRNIAILGQAAAILTATRLLQIPLPEAPLWSILCLLVLMNAYTWIRLRRARPVSDSGFFAQLLVDISALAGLLYFTGGATNPFASLFILQVVIAAIALPPLYTWMAACITIAFYTALMFWNVEMPYFFHHHIGSFFNLHVQGMWISFILLALIVAWFVVRMNNTIRRQEALLAEAEKLAAMGTLATGAAHELGTPLATLFVLAEDTGAKAPLFKEQLTRCKQILQRITAAGGVARAEGGAPVMLDMFVHGIIDRWQADHPAIALQVDIQKSGAPRIVGEYGVEQAIRNLLDNAADASAQDVRFHAAWTSQTLTVVVRDSGAGIAPALRDKIGEAGASTKEAGMGMGIFLVRSIVSRLDGALTFENVQGGGIAATITMPLKKLTV